MAQLHERYDDDDDDDDDFKCILLKIINSLYNVFYSPLTSVYKPAVKILSKPTKTRRVVLYFESVFPFVLYEHALKFLRHLVHICFKFSLIKYS